MRITKPLIAAVLSTGLLFGVTACGTSNTPSPTATPSGLSTTQAVSEKKLVAKAYEQFADGVFGMSTDTATQLTSLYSDVNATNYTKLSTKEAETLAAQTLTLIPGLKNIDVTGYTPQEQVVVYGTLLSIGIYSVETQTVIKVDATKVKIAANGKSAQLPYSAITASQNGVAATQSPTQSAEFYPFVKKSGKWYIDGKAVVGTIKSAETAK